MIISVENLKKNYSHYSDIYGRIKRDVDSGKLFSLTKGVYESNPLAEPIYLVGYIYGPSYLSFDTALSFYSLIPESTLNNYTCATCGKKKNKTYQNHFGTYLYRDIPQRVFSLGVNSFINNGYSYQIATKEKALCDKLYIIPPCHSIKELLYVLFNDLRIDENEFEHLNWNDIGFLAPLYHNSTLNYLVKFLKRRSK